MEIRFHGRGGQGSVTCAKIVATVYAREGKSVQAFGDYAAERSGAPVRAFARVSDEEITNRNKVYTPDHVLILDEQLLNETTVSGLRPGGWLLVNSAHEPAFYAAQFPAFRVATVDATLIARKHGIGTRTVTIINTTIAGAFAKLMGIPLDHLADAYGDLGFGAKTADNIAGANEAYAAVKISSALAADAERQELTVEAKPVLDLVEHVEGAPTGLKTGSWRVQLPKYKTSTAPCNAACPAGNDVVGFVQALADGDELKAAQLLAETTPLASVCGRVCPAFCMMSCNRKEKDGAVNIRGLERLVGDRHVVAATVERAAPRGKRVAIIGSGPAGLSAAYQLGRAGYDVDLFDAEQDLGGVLVTGIPAYRLPREVLQREIDGILALGVTAHLGERVDAARIDLLRESHDAVLVATGLQHLRRLEVPGHTLEGVEQGVSFLHRTNYDASAKVAGHVVVLGGGNTAMDCARNALRHGATKVSVVYRRTRQEMPAIEEEVHEGLEEGVEFIFQRSPVGFEGTGRVEGVRLAEVEMGEPDASGRRRPTVTDRVSRLDCDLVVMALGQSADRGVWREAWQLRDAQAFDASGALNVFFTGDLYTNEGTVVHAIGHGRQVADRVRRHLGEAITVEPSVLVTKPVGPEEVRMEHFATAAPHIQAAAEPAVRARSNVEVNEGLEDASEASRCFSCGSCTSCDTCLVYCPEGIIYRDGSHYTIDLAYCKGCGICVAECPRQSMEMVIS